MDSDVTKLHLEIPVAWNYVSAARQAVEAVVSPMAPHLCHSAGLVVSELIENAIKYGEPVAKAPNAQFRFSLLDNRINIEVSNGLRSATTAQRVMDRIRQIAESSNQEQLYLDRMQQLVKQPGQQGQLGLLRIGYEGQFNLSCTYEDEVLTVLASRGIK